MSDNSDYSEEVEVALDEDDQNDDADIADANITDDILSDNYDLDDSLSNQLIYGPLRSLNVRDNNHIIFKIENPAHRKTSHVIQLPEATEAAGIRASQIERGSRVFTNIKNLKCPIKMAWKEFLDRRNPLILERVVEEKPESGYYIVEHWRVREMVYLNWANNDELI